MSNHVINRSFRSPTSHLAYLASVACLLACSSTFAAEPQQTLYKWTDASGQTQYTQTPPEPEIPFEEINSQQTDDQTTYGTSASDSPAPTSTQGSSMPVQQTELSPRKNRDSFSPMPQNARIIPNAYHPGSTEYKVSPTKAALDKSRPD